MMILVQCSSKTPLHFDGLDHGYGKRCGDCKPVPSCRQKETVYPAPRPEVVWNLASLSSHDSDAPKTVSSCFASRLAIKLQTQEACKRHTGLLPTLVWRVFKHGVQ